MTTDDRNLKQDDDTHRNEHGKQEKNHQPAGTSGYPEPQPTPSEKHERMPNARTPHEPQNDPDAKPTRQSS